MYNIRLSLRKATLHRQQRIRAATQSPVTYHLSLAVIGLIGLDLLLFALLILRILETRG